MLRLNIFLLAAAWSVVCCAARGTETLNRDEVKEKSARPPAARVTALLYDESTRSLRPRVCENHCHSPDGAQIIAFSVYSQHMFDYGWNFLYVESNGQVSDALQAYSSGYVESYLWQEDIYNSWRNTVGGYCGEGKNLSTFCQELQTFLRTNLQWVKMMIQKNAATDPYWHMVELFYYRMAGLSDGYHKKAAKVNMDIDVLGLYLFQVAGDLEDLQEVLKPGFKRKPGVGHCSALVKLLPGNADLYAAQDTWSDYSSMLRVLKVYNNSFHTLPGGKDVIPGHTTKFSSYPGTLISGDDFYTLSSNMVSMETTIGNNNKTLNKYIHPENAVLEGVRNTVANRLATSGDTWAQIFSRYNSGTYNNEWMIVDYKQFVPNQKTLKPGVLTVLDQIPGTIKYKDLTSELEKTGYFASYNVAYFPSIFNASGGQVNLKKYGDWFSHDKTARANIFRRNQTMVKDLDSMIALMRYNNFKHDPLSRCNCTPPYSGENAISARSDLNPANGTYFIAALGHRNHGGTDMKVTSVRLMEKLDLVAWGCPTYEDLPPFQWSTSGFDAPHHGQPDLFKFQPVTFIMGRNSSLPFTPYKFRGL